MCARAGHRLFKNVRSPIPMQGLVIDESAVSRARVQPSCFWLRLPAICMTFDPSPTRAPHSPLPAKLSTLSLSLSLFLSSPPPASFSLSGFLIPLLRESVSRSRHRFFFLLPRVARRTRPCSTALFISVIRVIYPTRNPTSGLLSRVPRLVALSPFIIRD